MSSARRNTASARRSSPWTSRGCRSMASCCWSTRCSMVAAIPNRCFTASRSDRPAPRCGSRPAGRRGIGTRATRRTPARSTTSPARANRRRSSPSAGGPNPPPTHAHTVRMAAEETASGGGISSTPRDRARGSPSGTVSPRRLGAIRVPRITRPDGRPLPPAARAGSTDGTAPRSRNSTPPRSWRVATARPAARSCARSPAASSRPCSRA